MVGCIHGEMHRLNWTSCTQSLSLHNRRGRQAGKLAGAGDINKEPDPIRRRRVSSWGESQNEPTSHMAGFDKDKRIRHALYFSSREYCSCLLLSHWGRRRYDRVFLPPSRSKSNFILSFQQFWRFVGNPGRSRTKWSVIPSFHLLHWIWSILEFNLPKGRRCDPE